MEYVLLSFMSFRYFVYRYLIVVDKRICHYYLGALCIAMARSIFLLIVDRFSIIDFHWLFLSSDHGALTTAGPFLSKLCRILYLNMCINVIMFICCAQYTLCKIYHHGNDVTYIVIFLLYIKFWRAIYLLRIL